MFHCPLSERGVIKITGEQAKDFLQGLISNDINKASPNNLLYSLFLTPQGKIISDCFIKNITDDCLLLDVPQTQISTLLPKLNLYKLRQQIEIVDASAAWQIVASATAFSAEYLVDPRHKQLGWRAILPKNAILSEPSTAHEYHKMRINLLIPDFTCDLQPEIFFPSELGMDTLAAIDYKKGCYVGQEVTARVHHRGITRKQLYKISFQSEIAYSENVQVDGNVLGKMLGSIGQEGLAVLRIEAAERYSQSRQLAI